MKYGVYRIRNIQNNKFYIGSAASADGGLKGRWNEHRRDLVKNDHHSVKLQRAWNKYGADAFVFEILLYCDPQNCLMYEQSALDYFKPSYNMTLTTYPTFLGKIHSQEARLKISESKRGPKNPNWGKVFSEERRAEMSKVRKGRKFSAEHKDKIRQALLGKKHSEERKTKISKAKRKIKEN